MSIDPPSGSSSAAGGSSAAARLRRALDRLVRAARADGSQADSLVDLSADELTLALRLAFHRGVCAGPDGDRRGEPEPADLTRLADRLAAAGRIGAAVASGLRSELERLAREARAARLWRTDEPLWWEPLPEPPEPVRLAAGLAESGEDAALAAPAAAGADEPWTVLDPLLRSDWVERIHAELVAADRRGLLDLERAGVGAGGALSAGRSDLVRYVDGREPELLVAAPAFSVLVQTLLAGWAKRLARAAAGSAVEPPQKAMLARYPAPSEGYHPHLDNPGGDDDNGRAWTLVLYLNRPDEPPVGGDIALWPAGSRTDRRPAARVAPAGGRAVFFDSRRVPHGVLPLAPGPARWALTLWLRERPDAPAALPPPTPPRLTVTDLLRPIEEPPLPPGRVLLRNLAAESVAHRARSVAPGEETPRSGIVATVYRAGGLLEPWIRHHLAAGFSRLLLIFDRADDPTEAALAASLVERFGDRLTAWTDRQAARRWARLAAAPDPQLLRFARLGTPSSSVAARQTLNASAALEAAADGEWGVDRTGQALDWLLHLDADELFHLAGAARGGATAGEHFAALAAAGIDRARYLDHELLRSRGADRAPRFKLNPALAEDRLGSAGWRALVEQLGLRSTDRRPYFTGYHNGKAAVRIRAAAAAGGIHDWLLRDDAAGASALLAGPDILHFRFSKPAEFRGKYLTIAASSAAERPGLFTPAPIEERALSLVRNLRAEGRTEDEIGRRLEALLDEATAFSDREVELLAEAGLLLEPRLEHPLPVG